MASKGESSGEGTGTMEYNPYAGLAANFDPQAASSVYRLPETPEFLFHEEANIQRRTVSENLTFCSGLGYAGGAFLGGAFGSGRALMEAQRHPLPSRKLLANRVLNEAGLFGRRAGNSAGCLGLFYALADTGIGNLRDRHDNLNPLVAGGLAGGLFRSAHGVRPALVFAASGVALASLSLAARSALSS